MNLEEYRRIYMQAEGFGNTPKNLIQRYTNLAKALIKLPSAAKRDRIERNIRRAGRNEALQSMRDDGISLDVIKNLIKNRHRMGSHTLDSVENIGNSAISAAKSTNELGQTAKAIVGTTRSNSYDGQDVEKGIAFALTAKSVINKGMVIPKSMIKGVGLGLSGGSIVVNYIGLKHSIYKDMKRDKQKENERGSVTINRVDKQETMER